MKVSEGWLRCWANPAVDSEALEKQFSMAGLEVDGVEAAAPAFSGVVVGEVTAVAPHPDADKLKVCTVADGEGTQQVVCGAPNVTAGMKAPYARVGAVLPEGFKIKKAKLRGVESFGMLCGPDELGLSEERYGLMVLPESLETGADLRDALALNDTIFDIDLTPNRGDCLSVRGLARELAVLNRVDFRAEPCPAVAPTVDDTFPVTVTAPEACPRYLGRVIKGVDVTRPTPDWMVERLRRSGLRSIDPVVDITNYVMLELGQPMHAFDLHRLSGGITVRLAQDGDRLTLLDGSEVSPAADTLLICDDAGPVALAGIMGGERSGIHAEGEALTQDIFLECAYFSPLAIAGRARRFGLFTDASQRYERGVDFALQQAATERATALLLEICGGAAGPLSGFEAPEALPKREPITLRAARIDALLGTAIPGETVEDVLTRLACEVLGEGEGTARTWTVTPPSFRFDLEREADLIEEVARIFGYDNLEVALPPAALTLPREDDGVVPAKAFTQALLGLGGQEIITYSFIEGTWAEAFCPQASLLPLANPLSPELAVLRPSLLPGLVKTWQHNRNRQAPGAQLFELGTCFEAGANGSVQETQRLAGLLTGPRAPEQWGVASATLDFFDAKGWVEALLALSFDSAAFTFEPATDPALHPSRSAVVKRGEVIVGVVGALHPELAQRLDVPGQVYVFELFLTALAPRRVPQHGGLSRFPAVRRDLALDVPKAVAAGAVVAKADAAAGPLATAVRLFDVYEGKGVEPGRKSLALAITFQASDRTLGDEEVDSAVTAVREALASAFDARQR
jgi:phenylalanyl-tRNA synthetase beta chain